MKLQRLKTLPAGFLDLDPRDFYTILEGPTLIELTGKKKPALFISTLLHGNETSGVYILQALLKNYYSVNNILPRDLIIFIGNTLAAREGKRVLKGQLDFNRIWTGGNDPIHKIAEEVIEVVKENNVFASIDIHNNTGRNPHYACVNGFNKPALNLAKLFSRKIVYFLKPDTVLSIALQKYTTTVTLECGQSGDMAGIQRGVDFLEQIMRLETLSNESVSDDEIDVYHSVARILIPETSTINFNGEKGADFNFVPNFECLNFQELPEHSLLGWRNHNKRQLIILAEDGEDVADQYLNYEGNEIRTLRPVVPSMFNVDEKVIRQDCLGYFMQCFQIV